jgi:flagellar motor switch/type III secretory pathway protein FliN
MRFQILKLIVWPKIESFPPRIVEFEPGKVNVITGGSRTGKSAIIPIIDYCLASSDCYIPIDTIRDHSSWYGIVFQTESEQVLVCRKVPQGDKSSNDFYLYRGELISVPNHIKEPNENQDGVKSILNAISSVPYISLTGEEGNIAYGARLGFRDLMALIFQTQGIVANQNILFYKTYAHAHRERLRNWFPFILGAETIEILQARQRLQIVEMRLKQLKRELDKAKIVSGTWMANMLGHIKVAKEYGILQNDVSGMESHEELLQIAKQVIENAPNYSQTNAEGVEAANETIAELDRVEERLSIEIGMVKKQLKDIANLRSGFIDYGNSVQKRTDRLHISEWLEDVALQAEGCPVCGSSSHENTAHELKKISSAFKKYENETKRVAEVPTSFSREEDQLKVKLEGLIDQQKNLQKRFDLTMSKDKKAQTEFQRRKSMFLFLGHLKASIETFESLADGGQFKEEINVLEKEQGELQGIVDSQGVARRIERATSIISQGILNHLRNLDVEDKYRETAPRFSIKDLNISVLSNDGHWHFLAEVGSASNWVSFHLALMCSLQEYLIDQPASSVPSFVIFDQPSQVYFPKINLSHATDNQKKYANEDMEAVKKIFKTISSSISSKKGAWQCIILDHADSDIYGDINGVHEVEEWRNGVKLIPEVWYTTVS